MYDYQYPDCDGYKYEDSNDILIHMEFCVHCKRGYFDEKDQDIHEDLYEPIYNDKEVTND